LYNEEYAFLVGYPEPPGDWIKVPAMIPYGHPWELVSEDAFFDDPYYRQRLENAGATPESFTVLVGDRWVASLQTMDWLWISLVQTIRDDLPSFLQPIFPYRLFLEQLIAGSDQYISLANHEVFHAFQGMIDTQKFAAAENIVREQETHFPWRDETARPAWHDELDLISRSLQTDDLDETVEFVSKFVDLRAARRESTSLTAAQIDYEKKREWLEGLARYAKLEIWRLASREVYEPVPQTEMLTDFNWYAGFNRRWSREIDQISRMAKDEGDGRFYYTRMAQAYLLDRLMPGWKLKAFDDDVWLEDLLSETLR
jgi:hypothetical protein